MVSSSAYKKQANNTTTNKKQQLKSYTNVITNPRIVRKKQATTLNYIGFEKINLRISITSSPPRGERMNNTYGFKIQAPLVRLLTFIAIFHAYEDL